MVLLTKTTGVPGFLQLTVLPPFHAPIYTHTKTVALLPMVLCGNGATVVMSIFQVVGWRKEWTQKQTVSQLYCGEVSRNYTSAYFSLAGQTKSRANLITRETGKCAPFS